MLLQLGSVKLGLVLLALIAIYAALGSIPLGPLFDRLGGQDWHPSRTARHLPWIDLREREYFATPLFAALLTGVVLNMALATILRIRWEWRKSGVLITHAGVIVLAIGSAVASLSTLNATMAAFADEPASTAIDRLGTVIGKPGMDPARTRVGTRLPRYADFGTPWASETRSIELPSGAVVTGYAHSARLSPRLSPTEDAGAPGWQFNERLRSGETRSLALVADGTDRARAMLTDGTVVLALRGRFDPIELLEAGFESSSGQGQGGSVRIDIQGASKPLWLRAVPGQTAALQTPDGEWRAEFLDTSDFLENGRTANLRLVGPGFLSTIIFAPSWDPTGSGMYSQAASQDELRLAPLPVGIEATFMDVQANAVLLSPNGWAHFHRAGVQSGPALTDGEVLQLSPMTRVEIKAFLPQSTIRSVLERLPLVEDAQLLADPRLGSLVRIADPAVSEGDGSWIAFEDQSAATEGESWVYRPATLEVTDLKVVYRGFEAELFRRGSIPKDFRIELEFLRGSDSEIRTLSLNDPVRTRMRINGRDRRVQLSLIGWDSHGWEGVRSDTDSRFEGTRFVILSINAREGVDTAMAGGVLILLGAGCSMLIRLRRGRSSKGAMP